MTQIDLRYVSGRTNKSGKTLYYWYRRGFPLTRLYGDLQSLELAEQATKLNLAADGVASNRRGRPHRTPNRHARTPSAG